MSTALTVILSIVLFVGTAMLWEGVAYFMHRHVMHGFGWFLHEDHHRTHGHRVQKNDAYALFFAFCSFLLIYLGLLHHVPPVWSAGFGVALYGVGYVGFHDIMFHRRIPGLVLKPTSPYLRRIIAAHRGHHRTNTKEGARNFGFLWAPRSYANPQQGGEA
jgi:beta-carotene 3-hydroxylase